MPVATYEYPKNSSFLMKKILVKIELGIWAIHGKRYSIETYVQAAQGE